MSAKDFIPTDNRPAETTRNSVQLNVVCVVDVARALATRSLDNALMLIDNSVGRTGQPSPGRGTPSLVSQCNEGMVINWIIYSVAPYGQPEPVSISAIRFDEMVCAKLQQYGAIDYEHSPDAIPGVTPSYRYWAGLVRPGLKPGRYPYQIDFTIGDPAKGDALVLTTSAPSVEIWDVPEPELVRGLGGLAVRIIG
jgi:hypothetical protein